MADRQLAIEFDVTTTGSGDLRRLVSEIQALTGEEKRLSIELDEMGRAADQANAATIAIKNSYHDLNEDGLKKTNAEFADLRVEIEQVQQVERESIASTRALMAEMAEIGDITEDTARWIGFYTEQLEKNEKFLEKWTQEQLDANAATVAARRVVEEATAASKEKVAVEKTAEKVLSDLVAETKKFDAVSEDVITSDRQRVDAQKALKIALDNTEDKINAQRMSLLKLFEEAKKADTIYQTLSKSSLPEFAQVTNKAFDESQRLTSEFKEQAGVAKKLQKEYADLAADAKKFGTAEETLGRIINDTSSEIKDTKSAIIALEHEYKALVDKGVDPAAQGMVYFRSRVDDLHGELNSLERKLIDTTGELRDLGRGADKTEDALEEVAQSADRAGDEIQQTGNQAKTADKKMDDLGMTMFKASTMASLASNAIQEIGRAIVEFTKESAKAYLDYEDKTRRVFAQIPELSAAMRESLSRDARIIATEIGYLPSEVLPTLRKAMNLGISEDNIMSAIETASMAARIGGSDLTETLVLGQSVVNAYGEGIYTLSESFDLLNYITQNTNLEFTDLTAGMNQIISPAAEAGLALEDVAAMMIVMNRQGDDMNEIMDLLGPALTRIAVSTSASGTAFKEIAGVGFREFIDQGHNVVEAFQLIQDESDKTGESIIEMMSSGSDLYADTQTARAIAELTGRHLPELAAAYEDTAKARGTLSAASAEFADSDTLAVAQMTAAYESMKIEAGEAALSIATSMNLIENMTLVLKSVSGDMAGQVGSLTDAVVEQARETGEWEVAIKKVGTAYEGLGVFQQTSKMGEEIRQGGIDIAIGIAETSNSVAEFEQQLDKFGATTNKYYTRQRGIGGFYFDIDDIFREHNAIEAVEGSLQQYLVTAKQVEGVTMFDRHAFKDALEDVHNFVDVLEVLDGDTFKVRIDGEIESVRFANINTAEIAHEAGEMAMPYAQAAMDFTQKYVDENPVELDIKVGEETYGRIIASIPELESRLVAEGLAIPVPFELSGDQARVDELTIAMQAAAAAGKGMFADPILQAKALSGELVYLNEYYEEMAATNKEMFAGYREAATLLKPLEEAYDDLADAQGEWVEYAVDNSAKVASISAELAADLTDDQEEAYKEILDTVDEGSAEWLAAYDGLQGDLTESQRNALIAQKADFLSTHGEIQQGYTGDAKAAEEAEEAIVAAQEAIQESLEQTALSAFEAQLQMTDPAALESYLALQVALGNLTQAEADERVSLAALRGEAALLGQLFTNSTLTASQQAEAINLLSGGYETTATAAISAVEEIAAANAELALLDFGEGKAEMLMDIDIAPAAESVVEITSAIGTAIDDPYFAIIEADTDTAMTAVEDMENTISALVADPYTAEVYANTESAVNAVKNIANALTDIEGTYIIQVGVVQTNSDGDEDAPAADGEEYATGGYTGEGNPASIAGSVHYKEFVFSEKATDYYGVDVLNSMHQAARSGGAPAPLVAETGSTNSTALPPINMTMNFYGQTDADAVYDAARGGADDALEMARAMGRA